MPVTEAKRKEYSIQRKCRLLHAEDELLQDILKRDNITFVEFVRKAIKACTKGGEKYAKHKQRPGQGVD